MTKRLGQMAVAIGLVVLASPAAPALAGPIGDTGSFSWTRQAGYFQGSGGEFTLYNLNGLSNAGYAASSSNIGAFDPSFQTFCLETGEFAASPSYFEVSSAAKEGGEGVGGSDPISWGTAWLYSQFAKGTLANYFTGTRTTEAGLLQNAIWWLEGEGGSQNAYTAMAIAYFGSVGNATNNAAVGAFNVYVLNNYKDAARTVKAQDFLYATVPDGGTTLMLLGGALMGLGALRRKFHG